MTDILYHPESECYFVQDFTENLAAQGCHPLAAEDLPLNTRLPSGCGFSTVYADFDFETYSEVGFIWNEDGQKWDAPSGATKKGLFAVGAAVYAEHESTEVISLAYNLKDGKGERLWFPGCPPPRDLFDHIARGGLLEAWNDAFEFWIWAKVCEERLGWPKLPFWQLRDAMAKARAFALPGALGKAAEVLSISD